MLEGKTVLIVDFLSRIGEKLAYAFSEAGSKVILVMPDKEEEFQMSLAQKHNVGKVVLKTLDWASMEFIKERVSARFSKIDIIIYNTYSMVDGYFSHVDAEEIKDSLDKTIKGALFVSRAFLPTFLKQKGGLFINIVASNSPYPSWTNAIKEGMIGLGECLRSEVRKSNIRINTIVYNKKESAPEVAYGAESSPEGDVFGNLIRGILFACSQPPQASLDELDLTSLRTSDHSRATKSFKSKVVVITGASQGLGRVLTCRFVEEGALVVAAARNEANLKALAERLNVHGERVFPVGTDIRLWDQVQNLAEKCIEKFGKVDVLINNAAVWTGERMEQVSPEAIEAVVDTSLRGTLWTTRAFLPHLMNQRSGQVINISALVGRRGHTRSATYTSVKRAIGEFSRALREEVRPYGIGVTCVYPGSIAKYEGREVEPYKLKTLSGYIQITYHDVAEAVMFAAQQPFSESVEELVIRPVAERIGPRPPQLLSKLELYSYLLASKCKII